MLLLLAFNVMKRIGELGGVQVGGGMCNSWCCEAVVRRDVQDERQVSDQYYYISQFMFSYLAAAAAHCRQLCWRVMVASDDLQQSSGGGMVVDS